MKDADHEALSPHGADLRAPYEAPRFECEELFEVLALACGKQSTTPTVACQGNPNVS